MERALELERRSHQRWREEGDRRHWAEEDFAAGRGRDDWRDGTSDVDGVFSTCIFTFRELDWPDAAEYIEFGITVFKGIHQVGRCFFCVCCCMVPSILIMFIDVS